MANQDYTGIKVYQGNEPYIFVSYAHRDSEKVVPVIEKLQSLGFRVWFDMGIEAGTEWSNNIAAHLKECSAFLFFASHNSAISENCLDEVAYAKTYSKASLMIFLEEDVELPQGTEMQTARFQRIFYTRHKSVDGFVEALAEAPILRCCREVTPAQEIAQPVETKPAAPVVNSVPVAQNQKPAQNKKMILIAAAVAVAVVIGILCFVFIGGGTDEAGTYYLTYFELDGERYGVDMMDMLPEENYVVLNGDGTGYCIIEGYREDICYNSSKLGDPVDAENYSEWKMNDTELRIDYDGQVLVFEKG